MKNHREVNKKFKKRKMNNEVFELPLASAWGLKIQSSH